MKTRKKLSWEEKSLLSDLHCKKIPLSLRLSDFLSFPPIPGIGSPWLSTLCPPGFLVGGFLVGFLMGFLVGDDPGDPAAPGSLVMILVILPLPGPG